MAGYKGIACNININSQLAEKILSTYKDHEVRKFFNEPSAGYHANFNITFDFKTNSKNLEKLCIIINRVAIKANALIPVKNITLAKDFIVEDNKNIFENQETRSLLQETENIIIKSPSVKLKDLADNLETKLSTLYFHDDVDTNDLKTLNAALARFKKPINLDISVKNEPNDVKAVWEGLIQLLISGKLSTFNTNIALPIEGKDDMFNELLKHKCKIRIEYFSEKEEDRKFIDLINNKLELLSK